MIDRRHFLALSAVLAASSAKAQDFPGTAIRGSVATARPEIAYLLRQSLAPFVREARALGVTP